MLDIVRTASFGDFKFLNRDARTTSLKTVNLDLRLAVAARNDRWREIAIITFRTDPEVGW